MLVFDLASFPEFLVVIDQLDNYIELSTSLINCSHNVLEIDLEDIVAQLFCFGNFSLDFFFKLVHCLFLDFC